MAFDTKSLEQTVKNWTDVTSGRSQQYVDNSIARANKWLNNALAGVGNWRIGVSGSGVEARMRGNLAGKGARKYPAKIREVGGSRFSTGVTAAGPEFRSAIGAVLQTIASAPDPGRGPRGDPRNNQRSVAIQNALHQARLQALASGG